MKRAIDLFAGLGGFTEAATRLGISVLWAANHWAAAVEIHRANHPHVTHACQDLHQAVKNRVDIIHTIMNDSERFQIVMSRVTGRRITWRQLCQVDGCGFMGLE